MTRIDTLSLNDPEVEEMRRTNKQGLGTLADMISDAEEFLSDLDEKLNQMGMLLTQIRKEREILTLIPLTQHDARIRMNAHQSILRTGIACPNCGAELEDDDNVVMTSWPGQVKCHCTSCKWKGVRLA